MESMRRRVGGKAISAANTLRHFFNTGFIR
jgi:hypothetical protein